jgi:NADH:ubiquinone oxidoreductase subunit E
MIAPERPTPRSYDDADWEAEVRRICAELESIDGGAFNALHRLMEEFGYISEPALVLVAELMHLTAPQVFALATFYNEFRLEKPARTVLMLCRGPACRFDGMVGLRKTIERQLDLTVGEKSADGKFAVESSGCLGICPHAPAMLIDNQLVGRVSPDMLERLIAERSANG